MVFLYARSGRTEGAAPHAQRRPHTCRQASSTFRSLDRWPYQDSLDQGTSSNTSTSLPTVHQKTKLKKKFSKVSALVSGLCKVTVWSISFVLKF